MLKSKTVLPVVFGVALMMLASRSFAASEVVYDPGDRRDPFVPLVGDENISATSAGLRLEGIIYDPGEQSMAILNGLAYQKGDVVGDATIVKILKDHVVILVGGDEKTLWIRGEEKKQDS